MLQAREVERKLAVPPDFVLPALDGVKGVADVRRRTSTLRARYLDSGEFHLARRGATLRHRTGEGRPRWTLKSPSRDTLLLDRDELTVIGSRAAVPRALGDLLVGVLRGASLEQVVELHTRRTSLVLLDADGRELVDVVDDSVEVVRDGAVVDSWREFEVEQRPEGGPGATRVAGRVQTLLEGAGATSAPQVPKAVRALGVPVDTPGKVRRGDPVADLVRWSLATRASQLLDHDLGVRRELDDAVHQFRVTCRRLRSDLRLFRPLIAEPGAEELRGELAWLAAAFGQVRDLEVLRLRLRETAATPHDTTLELDLVDRLLADKASEAWRRGLEDLGSQRYLTLLRLLDRVADCRTFTAQAQRPSRDVLPELLDKAWHKLTLAADRLTPASDDAAWHRTRIAAKRARYTAETAQEVLGRTVRRQVRAAEQVQTHLGELQDSVMARDVLLALVAAHPLDAQLGLLCGRLVEREQRRAAAARREFLVQWPGIRW